MKKIFLLVIVFGFGNLALLGQPSLTIPHITGVTAGDTVEIPVIGSNLVDMGSLGFQISYWNTVIQYLDYQVVYTPLGTGFTNVMYQPGGATDWITLDWFSLATLTVVNDTLYTFRFIYWGGFTNITFAPVTGIVTNNGSIGGTVGTGENTLDLLESFVYPNPAAKQDVTLLTSGFTGEYQIQLLAPQGQILFNEAFLLKPVRTHITLPTSRLVPGLYLLRLISSEKIRSHKILIR